MRTFWSALHFFQCQLGAPTHFAYVHLLRTANLRIERKHSNPTFRTFGAIYRRITASVAK
jgi:hypothetical protein